MLLYTFKNFTTIDSGRDIPDLVSRCMQELNPQYEPTAQLEVIQPLNLLSQPIVFYYLPSFAPSQVAQYQDYRQQFPTFYLVLILPKDKQKELKAMATLDYQDYVAEQQISVDYLERVLMLYEQKTTSHQKLSKYLDLYNNLFISSALPMIVTCAYTNQIMRVNQATLDAIKVDEEWLKQRKITDLCHRDDLPQMEMNMASRTGERMMVRWCLPENQNLFIEFSSYNVIANEYPASLVIFTDVTQLIVARQQEKSSLSQFETIFDKTQEAILVFDDDGTIVNANKSALKLFRATENQLSGSSIKPLMTDGFKKSFCQIWQNFLENNHAKGITKIRDFENNQLIASYQLHKKLFGNYHLATLLDITDNYQKNQETLCLNEIHRLLAQTQSFNEPFSMALNRICEFTGYQTALLWVVDGTGKYLKNVSLGTHNFNEAISLMPSLKIEPNDSSWELQVLKQGQAKRGKQMREISEGKFVECNSFILPLKSKHKVVGILSLCAQDNSQINKRHSSFCKSISDTLGLKVVKINILKDWDNVFNHSNNYICTMGKEGSLIKVNPKFCKELGYTQEESHGKSFLQFVHQEDLGATRFDLDLAFDKNSKFTFTNRCIAKSGQIHWIEWNSAYDPNTNLGYLIGKDITKEQSAKKQYLMEAENSARILSSITDAYFTVDNQWRIRYANRAAEQLFDIDGQTQLGMYLWEVFNIHPYHPFFMEHVVAQDENREHTFTFYDQQSLRWLSVSCNPLNEGMAVSYRDITEIKKQEIKIGEMKSNLELLINNTDNYIWSIDCECRYVAFNSVFVKRVESITGLPPKVGELALNDAFPEETLALWEPLYERALQGETFFEVVSGFNPLKGIVEVSEINLYPMYQDGKIIGVSCFSKDITENTKYVKAIEEQNKKLKEIAWMQSHGVRAPLAKILGAVDLLMHDTAGCLPSNEVLSWVNISAKELDVVIHDIVKKASPWSPDTNSPNNLMLS